MNPRFRIRHSPQTTLGALLVVAFVLFGIHALLPLASFALFGPVLARVWRPPSRPWVWRAVSLVAVIIAVALGYEAGWLCDRSEGETVRAGRFLVVDIPNDFGESALMVFFARSMNFVLVAGVVMLPLSIASAWATTRRRSHES